MTPGLLVVGLILFVVLLYAGRGYWAWVSALASGFAAWFLAGVESPTAFIAVVVVAGLTALVFGLPVLRRHVVSARMMRAIRAFLPSIGDTERIALEAGTVWWDGDLFSGSPDWQKLLDFTLRPLSDDEQAFLDGPVEELCGMLDDWQIAHGFCVGAAMLWKYRFARAACCLRSIPLESRQYTRSARCWKPSCLHCGTWVTTANTRWRTRSKRIVHWWYCAGVRGSKLLLTRRFIG